MSKEVQQANDLLDDRLNDDIGTSKYTKPIKLDIGGGRDPLSGHINVDLRNLEETDVQSDATDLEMFEDESVSRIHANSLVPHLPNLVEAMQEWARVLEPGGELVLDATHAHSTGIVQDIDHHHWSWTAGSPEFFDADSDWAYYLEGWELELVDVEMRAWHRPDRVWLRPVGWAFGKIIDHVEEDLGDELMKLPFAAGRVRAEYRKR